MDGSSSVARESHNEKLHILLSSCVITRMIQSGDVARMKNTCKEFIRKNWSEGTISEAWGRAT